MFDKYYQYFLVKTLPLPSQQYTRLKKQALSFFNLIEKQSKRKPYIRSKYFKNKKIFLNLFLPHLFDKGLFERKIRLRYFPCAIELIRKTTYQPTIKLNPNKPREKLFRFYGRTLKKNKFAVQIKKNHQGKLYLMSVFEVK